MCEKIDNIFIGHVTTVMIMITTFFKPHPRYTSASSVAMKSLPNDKRDNKSVFQAHWLKQEVSMEDVQDAYELCKSIPKEQRDDCYAIFGVDRQAVEKYYHVVKEFNATYYAMKEKEQKEKALKLRLGKYTIYICKD